MKNTNITQMDRRTFIKMGVLAGLGPMIGLYTESAAQFGPPARQLRSFRARLSRFILTIRSRSLRGIPKSARA